MIEWWSLGLPLSYLRLFISTRFSCDFGVIHKFIWTFPWRPKCWLFIGFDGNISVNLKFLGSIYINRILIINSEIFSFIYIYIRKLWLFFQLPIFNWRPLEFFSKLKFLLVSVSLSWQLDKNFLKEIWSQIVFYPG